jgi:predicted metal-dependent enzyme (double-stranded beta helix superfamily)
MFDTDAFVSDCVAARAEAEPRRAIKEVLERALARPGDVAAALPPERAGIVPLHVSPELTVQTVVWAPGMRIKPHDHRVWAMIGIYSGGEDNAFFRRSPEGLVSSGGKELRLGDLCTLGDDAIHSVSNPLRQHTGAIHIYGGDFFSMERSEWDPETLEERPYDVAATLRFFEEANAEAPPG